MPDTPLTVFSFAFLVPIAYTLIAVAGFPAQRARHAVVDFLLALGLACLGYVATGFALQFGGIGLVRAEPGFDGLIWEWSALGTTWGPGWGMAGLAGWGLAGPAATTAARELALANLPWVATAVLIPVMGLRGRAPAWAVALLGLLTGAVVYPLAGNWLWAGGWLANLGSNLGLGHGAVDPGAAGLAHLLGAAVALAGFLIFWPRSPRREPAGSPDELPPAHFPFLGLLGVVLLFAGILPWMSINPLVSRESLDAGRILLNTVLAASAGALFPLGYTWLVTHRADPLMGLRGLGVAVTAMLAAAPFLASLQALATGALAGLVTPFLIFLIDRILRLNDRAAALTVHGLGGALGLAAVGLLADGSAGQGWNGIGIKEYLGTPGQGVTGLLSDAANQGQLQAQLVTLVALALVGFFAAWTLLAPPAMVFHLLQPRRRSEPVAFEPLATETPMDDGPAGGPGEVTAPVLLDLELPAQAIEQTGETAAAPAQALVTGPSGTSASVV